ncbi:MAG: ThiF family adenylyltransferase [bacterium]|nr:ThiF family adenylyltransferase [bacterium]
MINYEVTLIGLGGIGSWVANKVARLGCTRLVLCDPDIVEPHNLQNQDYDYQHIIRPKVQATELKIYGLAQWHRDHGREMRIVARQERVGPDTKLRGIVVVAVDSAQARREIFSACCYHRGIPLYIEAGAAENRGAVRVLSPHDKDQVKLYERLLEAYSEEGPAPCVTPHMSGQFASIITHWILRFNDGWRPLTMVETSIDYRQDFDSYVVTEPIL